MRATFAFGKTGIDISVPDNFNCAIVENRGVAPLPDLRSALGHALDHPIDCEPLSVLAAGKKRVTIVVCDITRPVPNSITLPPVLDRLHRTGITRDQVTILIATGLHRAATPAEVAQIVGHEIARSYRVVSNNARAHEEHRYLGTSSRGTPVLIHQDFVDADLRVTLGFIEPHLMAGFSGGRKLVVPGVAAEATIKAIHAPKFMREPRATEGSIVDNPLHAELQEIARLARHDFMLDVTLTRDRQISGVFGGNPVPAHASGVRFLEEACLEKVEEAADLVITSGAGFPLDLTFYQTIKAVTAAQKLVKDDGRILVVSECAEGVGSPEFSALLRGMQSFESFLEETANADVQVDQWQLEKLALAGLSSKLFFHLPGLKKGELGFLERCAYQTLDSAILSATAGLPPNARILLVPEGPYTFARTSVPHA